MSFYDSDVLAISQRDFFTFPSKYAEKGQTITFYIRLINRLLQH